MKIKWTILLTMVLFPMLLLVGVIVLLYGTGFSHADTVSLRGTNTIARGTNFPLDVPLTGKALLMSISQPMPPPLPLVTNRGRLKLVHDDYYELENLDPEDIIFSRNKPTVTQTKGGWRISFR